MFTTNHFIWIAICIVFIAVLSFFSLKFKFSVKVASLIMSGIAIISELMKIFTHINVSNKGGYLGANFLPLHLCSILIFITLYITFSTNEKRKQALIDFLVPIAIVGGLLAIFMSTSGVDFAKPFAYQCFLYHSGLIWYALHLICTKKANLGLKSYLRNLLWLICLVFIMLWINSALQVYDVNFFYLVKPPIKNLPVLNLNHGWYVYFISLIICGFLAVSLVHLPTIIIEIVKKQKTKKQSLAEKNEDNNKNNVSNENNNK